jgi:hypothetical protein
MNNDLDPEHDQKLDPAIGVTVGLISSIIFWGLVILVVHLVNTYIGGGY